MPSSPVLGVVPARRRSDDGEGNSHRFWSHRGIIPLKIISILVQYPRFNGV